MKNLAVQKGLTPIKEYLENQGYIIREFENNYESNISFLNKFDAIIINGQNTNILNEQKPKIDSIIVNANGMTPEQVDKQLKSQI